MQQTLARAVSFSGIGVHSGKKTRITIKPAPENYGIRFRRVDIPGTPDIQAIFKKVVDTSLATVVGEDGAIVSTIEHLMAAFAGLGIDNALVEINAYEMPIMDGSAGDFTFEMVAAGIKEQKVPKYFFVVTSPVRVELNEKFVEIVPGAGFKINCSIEFDNPLIGCQKLSFDPAVDDFSRDISRARTFGFIRDIEYLRKFSLARGGGLDNAVVIDEDKILNAEGLRYPDEFVRHKLLDCLGDFSLLGMPIQGHIRTNKSGHALNHAFITKFLQEKNAWETRPVLME